MALVLIKMEDDPDDPEAFDLQVIFDPPVEEGTVPTIAQDAARTFLGLLQKAITKADAEERGDPVP